MCGLAWTTGIAWLARAVQIIIIKIKHERSWFAMTAYDQDLSRYD